MSKTLIVLNPHAAGGRAGKLWEQIEPALFEYLGELVIAVTQSPDEVARHIDQAYQMGLTRVISIGGDGTNHSLINALISHNEQYPDDPQMVYGMLPIGTGRDWARSLGIPFNIKDAAKWIAGATPQSVDVGHIAFNGKSEYFLNIASAGIGGDVANRVDRVHNRRPWTFLKATVRSILTYQPQAVQVLLDGKEWYEGTTYAVAVANGTTFGHGMVVAPEAKISDGLFDVVMIEGVSKVRVLQALRMIYDGSHLQCPFVRFDRAQAVEIKSPNSTLGMELDGESAQGSHIQFSIRQGLLKLLV